jgi:drug/metabolite transporter (DMT)-like permease
MTSETRIRLKLAFGLALAIAFDTGVQLSWKMLALQIPTESSPWAIAEAVAYHPLFITLAILMVGQLINWLKVLEYADLSFAKPITSLSKISVCVVSVLYLSETVDLLKILGIAVVLAGVWCVCQTDRASAPPESAPQ